MDWYVGTSGWQYPHWRGPFYPRELPSSQWLGFYSKHFRTLEVNASFYREVQPSTFEKWYGTVPEGFLFSVKMSRFITHIKRLKVEKASVDRFLSGAATLKEKLGVILIQLPPAMKFDASLLSDFLDMLDDRYRYTLEVRNSTFIAEAFFSLIARKGIALCIAESAGRYPYSEEITAPFAYIRLHGAQALYASDYTDEELHLWASKIRNWGRDCFAYFDNDSFGYAAKNAITLKNMLEGGG